MLSYLHNDSPTFCLTSTLFQLCCLSFNLSHLHVASPPWSKIHIDSFLYSLTYTLSHLHTESRFTFRLFNFHAVLPSHYIISIMSYLYTLTSFTFTLPSLHTDSSLFCHLQRLPSTLHAASSPKSVMSTLSHLHIISLMCCLTSTLPHLLSLSPLCCFTTTVSTSQCLVHTLSLLHTYLPTVPYPVPPSHSLTSELYHLHLSDLYVVLTSHHGLQ